MGLDEAFAQPRIDVSGTEQVLVNSNLGKDIINSLKKDNEVELAQDVVFSGLFACPNAVMHEGDNKYGMAYIPSPWGKAISTS